MLLARTLDMYLLHAVYYRRKACAHSHYLVCDHNRLPVHACVCFSKYDCARGHPFITYALKGVGGQAQCVRLCIVVSDVITSAYRVGGWI